jgi:drug/metabolite transporter (DMT)-like permease
VTATGITLVLASAALHASWNFLVKRSGASGAAFTWLFTLPSAVLLAPVAGVIVWRESVSIPVTGWLWLAGSAVIHTVYFLVLQRGYLAGDLSVVYPVARGSGPLLAGLVAILVLGERPSLITALGALSIVGGTVALALHREPGGRTHAARARVSVRYGLLIGAFIGAYTVWDKHLVTAVRLHPIVLEWALSVAIALLVTPAVLHDRRALVEAWRRHRATAFIGALLSSASYVLFLFALRVLPVSQAAPLREVSVLLGALAGARLLAEGGVARRAAAAGVIAVGVVLISLG